MGTEEKVQKHFQAGLTLLLEGAVESADSHRRTQSRTEKHHTATLPWGALLTKQKGVAAPTAPAALRQDYKAELLKVNRSKFKTLQGPQTWPAGPGGEQRPWLHASAGMSLLEAQRAES